MIKWTSIEGLYNIIKMFRRLEKAIGVPRPVVTYRGKVKLHGTNAGIRVMPDGTVQAQSRNLDITPGDDNMGFATWVDETQEFWRTTAREHGTTVFYGEWCGKGIMKGTAINNVDGRVFCIFAVHYGNDAGDSLMVDPNHIKHQFFGGGDLPDNVYILPWATGELTCDFADEDKIRAFAETVNETVLEVEKCDPWVAETFGVEGVGEGLVYYPITSFVREGFEARSKVTDPMFKAKGEKHRVKKAKEAVSVDPEVAANINAFVDMFVTEARLEQGVAEACGGEIDVKKTGLFLKWFGGDVKKESVDDLEASGLTWKDVAKAVNRKARNWYIRKARKL